jgi:polyhydroxybutyrate depolymerase
VRRHLMTAALILAMAAGQVGVYVAAGAVPVAKKTRRDDSVAVRTSAFNHLSSGSHTLTLMVGNRQRTYILEVPPKKPVVNRALVLVYHGATDTAANTVQETNILQKAGARGDVVAFLQGYEDTWNEGSGSTPASLAHVNDVAFTADLIKRLRQLVSFDPSRVAAVGFSNGAIMVEDLGCHLASVISLIIPVEGQLSTVQSASCKPARPESVYEVEGTADSTIPYDGGYFSTSIGEDTVLSSPKSVARWARLDGCAAGPATSTPSSTISLSTSSKCKDDVSVTLRTINGGQHEWPPDIGQLVVQGLAHLPK